MTEDKPTPSTTPGPARVYSTPETSASSAEEAARKEEQQAAEEKRAAEARAADEAGSKAKPGKPVEEKPRRGSWMRPLLRIFIAMVVLLFLGALATYFWLFRPADQQLQTLRVEATRTAGQLAENEQALQQAQQDLEAAQSSAAEAQEQLDVELARVAVLRAINDLAFARMALQDNDAAGVTQALNDSESRLTEVLPLVEERDPSQASTLTALYTLAKNDLERDLELAGQDLDRIQSELERVEENVLQAQAE